MRIRRRDNWMNEGCGTKNMIMFALTQILTRSSSDRLEKFKIYETFPIYSILNINQSIWRINHHNFLLYKNYVFHSQTYRFSRTFLNPFCWAFKWFLDLLRRVLVISCLILIVYPNKYAKIQLTVGFCGRNS